jgi:choline dehydrogenase-like flavoprotein
MAMDLPQGTTTGSVLGLPEAHRLCRVRGLLVLQAVRILVLLAVELLALRYVKRSSGLRLANDTKFAPNATAPRRTVFATREVIVAAGALHSAQLLQLSGIGPSSLLAEFNIPMALNVPGVGNNLQDHCLVGTFYPCKLKWIEDLSLLD